MAIKISPQIKCYKCNKVYAADILIKDGSENSESTVKTSCFHCLEENKIPIKGVPIHNSSIYSGRNG